MANANINYKAPGSTQIVLDDGLGLTRTIIVNVSSLANNYGVTLPRVTPTVAYPTVTGSTILVHAGGDLQTALNNAQYGDEVVIDANASFPGNFVLPGKSGWSIGKWIIVRTSNLSSLPFGTRVKPADAVNMPKIVGVTSNPTIFTPFGGSIVATNGWYLAGLEVTIDPSLTIFGGIVVLGDGSGSQDDISKVSQYFVVDRCYIHGTPTCDMARGLAPNCGWLYVHDCYISDCHSNSNDSQAIACWNATGPHHVTNCYLEGSGENILYGGANPGWLGQVPEDITYTKNHIYKPTNWNRSIYGSAGIYGNGGTGWEVKNSFEVKNARYVLIDSNVIENCWADGQSGWTVLLKTVNQADNAIGAQNETAHVTVRNNLLKNIAAFIQVSGLPQGPGINANHLAIYNNVAYNIGNTPTPYGTGTYTGQQSNNVFWSGGCPYTTFAHNTGFGNAWNTLHLNPDVNVPQDYFTFINNLTGYDSLPNQLDDGNSIGTATLNNNCPHWTWDGNVIVGANASAYPTFTNHYPSTFASLNLNADLTLPADSVYKNSATDGTDPGADIGSIITATTGVVQVHG